MFNNIDQRTRVAITLLSMVVGLLSLQNPTAAGALSATLGASGSIALGR